MDFAFGEYVPNPDIIGLGDCDDRVLPIQKMLVGLGFPCPQNGQFDPETEKAVQMFQRSVGMTPSGTVDKKVLSVLKDRAATGGKKTEVKAETTVVSKRDDMLKVDPKEVKETRKKDVSPKVPLQTYVPPPKLVTAKENLVSSDDPGTATVVPGREKYNAPPLKLVEAPPAADVSAPPVTEIKVAAKPPAKKMSVAGMAVIVGAILLGGWLWDQRNKRGSPINDNV